MSLKSMNTPDDRCGFTRDDHAPFGKSHCCYRETWGDRDHCIWHAPVEDNTNKPIEILKDTMISRSINNQYQSQRYNILLDGADLSGQNLDDNIDFANVSLYKADFTSTSLEGANFQNVNAFAATFLEATFDQADFTDAILYKANFADSSGIDVDFTDAYLVNCNLDGASCKRALFDGANLEGAKSIGSELPEASFYDAVLDQAQFDETILYGSDLTEASLEYGTFTDCDARFTDFTDATLAFADFENTHFNNSTLRRTNFRGVNLTNATLFNTDCREAKFHLGSFEDVDLTESDLRQATLPSGESFSNGNLRDVQFSQQKIIDQDLSGATLPGADLSGMDLSESSLAHSDLQNANLTETKLHNSNLDTANLEGALMNRTSLFGASLCNAKLFGAAFSEAQIDINTTFFSSENTSEKLCAYHPDNSHSTVESDDLEQRLSKAAATYRLIETVAERNAFSELKSAMFIQRQQMQTRRHHHRGNHASYWYNRLSRFVLKFGESYWRVIGWSITIISIFAVLYPFGGNIQSISPEGQGGPPISWSQVFQGDVSMLWESFYYSTLTFTALGFGDYQPVGFFGQVLTVAETSLGAVLLALLVFVLGRRSVR
jgi:uncharacterized protein YjbI with pentapeptide repeats